MQVFIELWMLQEIPLSEILSVEATKEQVSSESGQSYCFELRTANVDYYIGEDPDMSRGWEVAVRQALMPVTAPTKITLMKESTGIISKLPIKIYCIVSFTETMFFEITE